MRRPKLKERHQLHLYLEREQANWVCNQSLDLDISSSAYIRGLIEKERNKIEPTSTT